jgi:uncharacterized protein
MAAQGPVTSLATDRGDWMQTFTGRAFYPMAPAAEDVDGRDIAHALSLLCRYGGHSRSFYSVGEHCVLMSYAVSPANALEALLHDATEAYGQDLIRPVKNGLPEYKTMERRIEAAIRDRFGLTGKCPEEVKVADVRILRDEKAVLMGPPPLPWTSLNGLEPLGVQIHGWAPQEVERRYYDRLGWLLASR